jgi:chromosome segregation ATPase
VIEQLETLFDNLEEDLTDAKSAAIDKENAAIAVYNETVDEYNAIRATLAATISNLEDYLQVLEDGIDTENSVSASASAKVARNTDALQHALDMLAAFDTEYTNSTQARNDELALLNKLKNFINEQADIFGDFGNDGVDAYQ